MLHFPHRHPHQQSRSGANSDDSTGVLESPAPLTQRGTHGRARRRLIAGLAALAAFAGVFLSTTAPANAWYSSYTAGPSGTVTFGTLTGHSVRALPGYTFTTPPLIIYRNGVIPSRYQQEF